MRVLVLADDNSAVRTAVETCRCSSMSHLLPTNAITTSLSPCTDHRQIQRYSAGLSRTKSKHMSTAHLLSHANDPFFHLVERFLSSAGSANTSSDHNAT